VSNRQIGQLAENHVAADLERRGWIILARNLRTPYAEVDLLAQDPRGILVIVEVKARHPLAFLTGENHLTHRQLRRLEAALLWLADRRPAACGLRLDLAVVQQARGEVLGWELLEGLAGLEGA
jgi:putative endonuclease